MLFFTLIFLSFSLKESVNSLIYVSIVCFVKFIFSCFENTNCEVIVVNNILFFSIIVTLIAKVSATHVRSLESTQHYH
jgi:hypothetical protein